MKKQQLAIIGAVTLVAIFAVGGYLYKQHRDEQNREMAKAAESPLNRSYAQTLGPADAKVVIVEFFDPGCETCKLFADPVKKLLDKYSGKVRLQLRYAPFHHGADKIVAVLEAARLQGKYWETLQLLWDTQHMWASHHQPNPDLVWQFLPKVGLDMARLEKDVNDPKVLELIQQDIADAQTLGVHKTPGFFVNGRTMTTFGFQQLEALVWAEVQAKYGS